MYLIDAAGNYPRHIGDLQIEHPDWTEDQPLPEGWSEVHDTDLPDIPEGYTLAEAAPTQLEDGTWQRVFKTRKLTKAELAKLKEADNG